MSHKGHLPGTELEVSILRGLVEQEFDQVVAWLREQGAAILYANGGTIEYVI